MAEKGETIEYPDFPSGEEGSKDRPLFVPGRAVDTVSIAWNMSHAKQARYFFRFHDSVFALDPTGNVTYSTEIDQAHDENGKTMHLVREGLIGYLVKRIDELDR